MDLADIWQAHKRFILGVAAGFIVFLIAQSVVGSTWNVQAVRTQALGTYSRMRKLEVPRPSELSAVEREAAEYQEILERECAFMHYETPERYRLPPRGSPDLIFNELREDAVRGLVNGARRRNIEVDPTLGLEAFTPTGREAIQRSLRGLAIVEQVVLNAVDHGVDAVDEIRIQKAPGRKRGKESAFVAGLEVSFRIRGSTPAIAGLIDALARPAEGEGYLSFVEYDLQIDDKDPAGRLILDLKVAGLTIDPEAELSGGRR